MMPEWGKIVCSLTALAYFKDEWGGNTNYTGSLSFGGIHIGGGLGYNWKNVSLGASINLRKASEYRESVDAYIVSSSPSSGTGGTEYGIVMSAVLTSSVRF